MRTTLTNDLKLSFLQPLVPVLSQPRIQALKELPAPKGGAKLDGIRRHITALRDSDKAAKAALLGLVAIPTAIVSLINPSPASATPSTTNDDGTALATATLFSMPKVQLAAKDDNERELVTKIGELVARDFHGDTRAAFNHYAGSDHQVSRAELLELLSDAGIGNVFTRSAWASGIMDRLDKAPHGDGNGKISWTEFNNVIGTGTA